ncbi:ABC transporter permease [Nonomuraea ferruginea]
MPNHTPLPAARPVRLPQARHLRLGRARSAPSPTPCSASCAPTSSSPSGRPGPAWLGYDVAQAVTFCFVTQAFIGPMQLFGGGLAIPQRIRSGDIALDLVRPAPLQLWTLAEDLGRAGYLLLVRGIPPMLVGAALFGIVVPDGPGRWAGLLAGLLLGVVTSFGWRYLVALSACWLADDRGVNIASTVLTTFLSGLVLPLTIFPGWLGDVARVLPWAAMAQAPADLYLGTAPRPRHPRLPGVLGRRAARPGRARHPRHPPQGGDPGWLGPTFSSPGPGPAPPPPTPPRSRCSWCSAAPPPRSTSPPS